MRGIPPKLKGFKSNGAEVVRAVKKVHSTGKEARRILIIGSPGTVLCTEKDKKVRRYFQYKEISKIICQRNDSGTIQILIKLLPPEYDILLYLANDKLNGGASTWEDVELIINTMKGFYRGGPAVFEIIKDYQANLGALADLKKPAGYLPPAEKVKRKVQIARRNSQSPVSSPRSDGQSTGSAYPQSPVGSGHTASPTSSRHRVSFMDDGYPQGPGSNRTASPQNGPQSPSSSYNQVGFNQNPQSPGSPNSSQVGFNSPAQQGVHRTDYVNQNPQSPGSPNSSQVGFNSPAQQGVHRTDYVNQNPQSPESLNSSQVGFNMPPRQRVNQNPQGNSSMQTGTSRSSGYPPAVVSAWNSPNEGQISEPSSLQNSPAQLNNNLNSVDQLQSPKSAPSPVASPPYERSTSSLSGKSTKRLELICNLGEELGLVVSETPEGLVVNDPTLSSSTRTSSPSSYSKRSVVSNTDERSAAVSERVRRLEKLDHHKKYEMQLQKPSPSSTRLKNRSHADEILLQKRMAALQRERNTLEQWEHDLNRRGRG